MRRLALFSGGFCAAILLFALGLSAKAAMILTAIASAGSVCAAFFRKKWSIHAAICFLGLAVGFGWCAAEWRLSVAPLCQYDGRIAEITAEASEDSRSTDYGTSTTVRLNVGGTSCTAVLYGDETLHIGDVVKGRAKLRLAGMSFGEEDLYLSSRGILIRASLRPGAVITPADGLSPRHWPAAFGSRLKESLRELFSPEKAAFEIALLTGDSSELSQEFNSQLSRVGLKHMVAVSGMHIAILMGLILLLFGHRRRLSALLGLPVIWFFALTVGMTASVVRSAVMQSFLMLAPLFRRENDPPTSLFTALMLILIPNPRAILNVGLQLSFASVAGILIFAGPLYRAACQRRWMLCLRNGNKCLFAVVKTMLAQVIAAVSVLPLTLPLSVLYFQMYSLISPLSSALIVSVVPLCFSMGIMAAIFSMVWLPLGTILAWPVSLLTRYVMGMTQLLSKIPYAAVDTGNGYLLIFLAGVYLAAMYFLVTRRQCRPAVPASCLAGLLSLCLLLSSLEYDWSEFSLVMLNVGQGQSIYVESGGKTLLYDCGGNGGNAGETAARFLESHGRFRLDCLVISHYDTDHAGGVEQLLNLVQVDKLFLPNTPDQGGLQQSILNCAAGKDCEVHFVTEDLTLRFGNGEAFLYAPLSDRSDNEGSIAAQFRFGTFDMLMTGDMGVETERKLLRTHDLSGVEVLVAGHHGAKGSTGEALLETAEPAYVLVSVGDNSYGHPAPQTLKRIQESGALVYRTDQCGNITIRR